MSTGKLSDKYQMLAMYVLNKELGYSLQKISDLMGMPQDTIANAVQETQNKLEKLLMQKELEEVRRELANKGYIAASIGN